MPIYYSNNQSTARALEKELFDKEQELPNNILLKRGFIENEVCFYEKIMQEEIIDIILSKRKDTKVKYYISTWHDYEGIYEMVLDNDIKEQYVKFMCDPTELQDLKLPKFAFGLFYGEVFIFSENLNFVIIASRYFDETHIYSWY